MLERTTGGGIPVLRSPDSYHEYVMARSPPSGLPKRPLAEALPNRSHL